MWSPFKYLYNTYTNLGFVKQFDNLAQDLCTIIFVYSFLLILEQEEHALWVTGYIGSFDKVSWISFPRSRVCDRDLDAYNLLRERS